METYTILFSGVTFIQANSSEEAYNKMEEELAQVASSWEIQVSD
jgi:hypothetical protein